MQGKNYFEDSTYLNTVVNVLRSNWRGVTIEPGLSETELAELEEDYGICFPPDLAAFLRHALPVGDGFPDWRGRTSPEKYAIPQKSLSWPLEGILFDVEWNDYWLPSWGTRPAGLKEALAKTKDIVESAPKLIPVCSHRYLPSEPKQSGNPVLSVYQTDIIPYGDDLADYFWNEFRVPLPESRVVPFPRRIPFWDDLVDENNRPWAEPR